MKAYIAYSRDGGAEQGAVVVFAHNRRGAKLLAWHEWSDICNGEYLDLGINLLTEPQLFENADKAKLERDEAHIIDNPRSCSVCELWGNHLNEDGICDNCIWRMENTPGE